MHGTLRVRQWIVAPLNADSNKLFALLKPIKLIKKIFFALCILNVGFMAININL